jgi:hypothetical protein
MSQKPATRVGNANLDRKTGYVGWKNAAFARPSRQQAAPMPEPTGTLQQQSKTSTVPAINLLNIAVTELRLTEAGCAICDGRHIVVCVAN